MRVLIETVYYLFEKQDVIGLLKIIGIQITYYKALTKKL